MNDLQFSIWIKLNNIELLNVKFLAFPFMVNLLKLFGMFIKFIIVLLNLQESSVKFLTEQKSESKDGNSHEISSFPSKQLIIPSHTLFKLIKFFIFRHLKYPFNVKSVSYLNKENENLLIFFNHSFSIFCKKNFLPQFSSSSW